MISNHTTRRALPLLAASLVGLALIGCDTTPRNEGAAKSYRIESRLPSEGPQLGSADLVVASEQAVASIADVSEIRDEEGPTVVVMDRIENETSDPSADFQIYLARIRALLNESGAQRDLAFVADRSRASSIRAREGLSSEEPTRVRPKYALTGIFYDMPRGQTNYNLLTFQLIDLTSELVIWENSYEVKL